MWPLLLNKQQQPARSTSSRRRSVFTLSLPCETETKLKTPQNPLWKDQSSQPDKNDGGGGGDQPSFQSLQQQQEQQQQQQLELLKRQKLEKQERQKLLQQEEEEAKKAQEQSWTQRLVALNPLSSLWTPAAPATTLAIAVAVPENLKSNEATTQTIERQATTQNCSSSAVLNNMKNAKKKDEHPASHVGDEDDDDDDDDHWILENQRPNDDDDDDAVTEVEEYDNECHIWATLQEINVLSSSGTLISSWIMPQGGANNNNNNNNHHDRMVPMLANHHAVMMTHDPAGAADHPHQRLNRMTSYRERIKRDTTGTGYILETESFGGEPTILRIPSTNAVRMSSNHGSSSGGGGDDKRRFDRPNKDHGEDDDGDDDDEEEDEEILVLLGQRHGTGSDGPDNLYPTASMCSSLTASHAESAASSGSSSSSSEQSSWGGSTSCSSSFHSHRPEIVLSKPVYQSSSSSSTSCCSDSTGSSPVPAEPVMILHLPSAATTSILASDLANRQNNTTTNKDKENHPETTHVLTKTAMSHWDVVVDWWNCMFCGQGVRDNAATVACSSNSTVATLVVPELDKYVSLDQAEEMAV
ncbi:hypothetical protein ACA910_004684 [Epithemia clementina (nom. ined.)]